MVAAVGRSPLRMTGKSGVSCKRAADEAPAGPASKDRPSTSSGTSNDCSVVVKGVDRSMRSYNPIALNRNLCKFLGGSYADIKVLPSGDLLIRCRNSGQMNKMLSCTDLGDCGKPIQVTVSAYTLKPIEVKGVISNVPLDLSDAEIKEAIAGNQVTFVRRFSYRSDKGVMPSRSVLVCFNSTILPAIVDIGYLRFRPRPYVPPPLRCFNCNRYGHQAKKCRSVHRCTKCGGRHAYESCTTSHPKCINCGGVHSAGYGGCPRYRYEAAVNATMVKEKVGYWAAREIMRTSKSEVPPSAVSYAEFPALPKSSGTNQIENEWNAHRASPPAIQQATGNNQVPPSSIPNETANVHFASQYNADHISIPTESFFVFIAQIIKNTLLAVSDNKQISVVSIIAQSAAANLGIPIVWRENDTVKQCQAMDLSKKSEPQTS